VRVRNDDGSTDIEAASVLIAAGSEPRFFPSVKPDGDRIIAPRHTQKLQRLPESMVMVGGGVTGSEYTSAFQKLGTNVHLITDIDRLLPRTDPELATLLQRRLEQLGVEFSFNNAIKSVENLGNEVRTTTADGTEYRTDFAFVATGRRPDDSFLEEAEERPEQDAGGWLRVDAAGRTTLDGVYAAGDITGAPLTANNAHTVARRVIRDILGTDQSERLPALIEAVYTEPQVVHIGPVQELSTSLPAGVTLRRYSYNQTLLGRIHGDGDALFKLWLDDRTNAIRGAAAFGESAVDILAPVQLAMEHGISADALRSTPLAHPALSEVLSL
jgi:dihydrolipoamide dehydrogenase